MEEYRYRSCEITGWFPGKIVLAIDECNEFIDCYAGFDALMAAEEKSAQIANEAIFEMMTGG